MKLETIVYLCTTQLEKNMTTSAQTQKITLATLKSFAKKNQDKLFTKEKSSFNGMTDCVESTSGTWSKTSIGNTGYYRTGIQGVYTVGSSRDWFTHYEDSEFIGIEVSNCCGNSILAIRK